MGVIGCKKGVIGCKNGCYWVQKWVLLGVRMGVILNNGYYSSRPFVVNRTFNATPTERLQQWPILLFSALDAESESLVSEALERAAVGRTTLTIAHRLSTVRKADVIVVLDDNGNVKETGSYVTLMSQEGGAFRQLVEKQMFSMR